ncbi:S-adenosyl-L-methionine-dependent methyltransferase [Trichoderma evansii]
MASSDKPAYLPPSKLGTKEYWDSLYTTELTNHAANPSDTGTNWFDDSDAEGRIVAFLESLTEDDQDVLPEPLSQADASFLDLGCGNGSLLFALRDEGWEGAMLGVDYSGQSVALAKNIAESRKEKDDEDEDAEEEEDQSTPVNFLEWDLLNGPLTLTTSPSDSSSPLSYTSSPSRLYDIILDKGTFDAISLSTHEQTSTTTTSEQQEQQPPHPCEVYRRRLLQLLSPNGGIFLITSCNWTEPELRSWFLDDKDGELSVVGRVDYPTFTFGGVKGQTISTLCFRRK